MLINARSSLVLVTLCQTQMQPCGDVPLPVRQPNGCTFGGPELSDLFITSARDSLADPSCVDGTLLTIKTRYTGKPACRLRVTGYGISLLQVASA